jgi:hypothetical protein
MAKQVPEMIVPMRFPYGGIMQLRGFEKQQPGTTRFGVNVRAFDQFAFRRRGGSRAGLARYIPQIVNTPSGTPNPSVIQEVTTITTMQGQPGAGAMQTSQSGRVVTLLAVQGGNVYYANAGDSSWSATNNNTPNSPPLNATGLVFSSVNVQKVFFADGANWCYYDPLLNTVSPWAATAGQLPGVTGSLHTPRLTWTWRGRTGVAGLVDDPENWFLSAVGNPFDWNYAGQVVVPGQLPSTTSTQAVAGENAPQGVIGDVVTGVLPYTDDVCIFFGDHTIWLMQGDPMMGGQISLVSNAIGGAWGVPACMDPYGNVYFFSNKTGIYSLVPGNQPVRISQGIEQILANIDTGSNSIRMIWNDRFQGLHVFVTPLAAASATTHFFWEQRVNAWWEDQFANPNHSPLVCCTLDGNTPGDRVPLIGSWDGYVRAISPTATTDDGTAIASSVLLGPLNTEQLDEMMLTELQGVFGESSSSINYAVFIGTTAEAAYNNYLAGNAVLSGVCQSGRNLTQMIRRAAHAVYISVSSSNPWAMEEFRLRVATMGKIRRRGYQA